MHIFGTFFLFCYQRIKKKNFSVKLYFSETPYTFLKEKTTKLKEEKKNSKVLVNQFASRLKDKHRLQLYLFFTSQPTEIELSITQNRRIVLKRASKYLNHVLE